MFVGERLRTTAAGSLGLTLADDRLIAAGPHSPRLINDFQFDTTTHEGDLLTTLAKRTLSVVTGPIARQSPQKVLPGPWPNRHSAGQRRAYTVLAGSDAIFASTLTAFLKKA